jgi:hypothetical protein
MPTDYSLDSLPKPNDDRVKLVQVLPQRFAVRRFSGSWSDSNFQKHIDDLREFLAQRHYTACGDVQRAYYNPPWTPLPFRRNEVLIPISD